MFLQLKSLSKLTLFLLITFLFSGILAGSFYLVTGGKLNNVTGFILPVTYMFMPMLAVLIVEKLIYKSNIRQRLLISFEVNYWWLAAIILPVVIIGATFFISLLLPGIQYSPEMSGFFGKLEGLLSAEEIEKAKADLQKLPVHPAFLTLLQGIVAGATINAVAAFGEELGWRGFLVDQFRKVHFLTAAVTIGFIWGIWHAPLILMGHNYPQHPQMGVLMMTVWCILLSPVFLYITIKTRSVIAASVMHGVTNGIGALAVMLVEGGNDLTIGATGLAGFLALAVIIFFMFLYDVFISGEKIMLQHISAYLSSKNNTVTDKNPLP